MAHTLVQKILSRSTESPEPKPGEILVARVDVVMICPEVYDLTEDTDIVSVNLTKGKVINETKSRIFRIDPVPQTIMRILQAGGLIKYAIEQKW